MFGKSTLALLCLLCVPLAHAQEAPARRTGGKVPIRSTKNGADKAISDKEATDFAQRLIAAIRDRKFSEMDRLFDWNVLNQKITNGIEMPAAMRTKVLQEIHAGMNGPSGLWDTLTKQLAEGGRLDLLHVRRRGSQTSVLIRLLPPGDAGVNYHKYPLKRRADGAIQATDMEIYAAGQNLTQVFRRSCLQSTAATDRGFLARLTGQESDYARHMDEYLAVIDANKAKDFPKVLKLYDALPQSLKKDRNILTLRIFAAQEVGENEYIQAVNDFQAWYPNDVALMLLTIDRDLFQKKYDNCLKSLDAIDKRVGGDPYLDMMRGGVHLAAGNSAAARSDYDRAYKRDPSLTRAAFTRIGLALQDKDNPTILRLLEDLEEKSETQMKDLRTVPAYAEFVKSPEFEQWEARHPARPDASAPSPAGTQP